MSVRRSLLATALATAVATSTLAVTAPTPASAKPATTTYECTFPDLEEVDVPLTLDVSNLPARLPVGVPVAASTWDVRATLHLDDLTTAYLLSSHSHDIIAEVDGLTTLLGGKPAPLDIASGVEALPVAEPLDVPMVGTNRELTPKVVGDVPLELPDDFTLDLYDGDRTPLFSVECEWWDGDLGVVGTVSVVKQSAAMTRKLVKKPVKTTKRAKLRVSVLSQTGQAVTGEVKAAIGQRTLVLRELTDGRVTLRLPRLRAGKHRVTLTYLGSKVVDKTTRNVTVKVVRPRR